jgi:para-nitrobenzyl esterase
MKFFRAIDPAVDMLDEAGLLARCRGLLPEAGQAWRMIEMYRAARQACGEDTSPPEIWFAISGDHVLRALIMRQAERYAAHTPQTYAYLFTWRSPAIGGRLGAAHTMEIPFIFGRLDDPGMGPLTGQGSAVQRLSEQMMDAWIAFARTGNPATAALPGRPTRLTAAPPWCSTSPRKGVRNRFSSRRSTVASSSSCRLAFGVPPDTNARR